MQINDKPVASDFKGTTKLIIYPDKKIDNKIFISAKEKSGIGHYRGNPNYSSYAHDTTGRRFAMIGVLFNDRAKKHTNHVETVKLIAPQSNYGDKRLSGIRRQKIGSNMINNGK